MSKKIDFYFDSQDGRTNLHGIKWEPEGTVKAIIQISHGMVEFIERYDEFANHLNEQGILVIGHDHLGHGKSICSPKDFGYFAMPHPNQTVLADLYELTKLTQKAYEGVPYFLLGHSMGSFYARQYLCEHGTSLDGIIIMGTGNQSVSLARLGLSLTNILGRIKGWYHRSTLIDQMAFGGYNKRFEPARTSKDWLTRDEAIVDAYINHECCQFMFTVNGYHSIFTALTQLGKKNYLNQMPKEIPVLFVSGEDDPVGDFGKGIIKLVKQYQKLGMKTVSYKLYEKGRHEILNEIDRQMVYEDIVNWIVPLCSRLTYKRD